MASDTRTFDHKDRFTGRTRNYTVSRSRGNGQCTDAAMAAFKALLDADLTHAWHDTIVIWGDTYTCRPTVVESNFTVEYDYTPDAQRRYRVVKANSQREAEIKVREQVREEGEFGVVNVLWISEAQR